MEYFWKKMCSHTLKFWNIKIRYILCKFGLRPYVYVHVFDKITCSDKSGTMFGQNECKCEQFYVSLVYVYELKIFWLYNDKKIMVNFIVIASKRE